MTTENLIKKLSDPRCKGLEVAIDCSSDPMAEHVLVATSSILSVVFIVDDVEKTTDILKETFYKVEEIL